MHLYFNYFDLDTSKNINKRIIFYYNLFTINKIIIKKLYLFFDINNQLSIVNKCVNGISLKLVIIYSRKSLLNFFSN